MDSRYPVGKFSFDPAVTPEKRRAWIATIDALPASLRQALDGLPPAALDTPYREGGWTVRQVIHHLADSHSNAFTRLKLALTEDNPLIKTYEEQLWAELVDSKGDPAPSLQILDGIHTRMAQVLATLTPEQCARTAQHPQWGAISVDWLIQMYAWHSRHHVAHIGLVKDSLALSAVEGRS